MSLQATTGVTTGFSQRAATVAYFGSSLSLVLIALLHIIEPELDPSWRMVSEYANGAYGWVMTLAFLAHAAGCAALVVALHSHARGLLGRIGLFFLVVVTIGIVIAAMFPMDPITIAPSEATTAGSLHGLGSMLGIPVLPVAAMLVSLALARQPAWRPVRALLLWSAAATFAALIIMFASVGIGLAANGGFGPETLIGWPNRLVVLVHWGWVIVVAWQASRLAQH
jgi:hypothetical protein